MTKDSYADQCSGESGYLDGKENHTQEDQEEASAACLSFVIS